MCCFSFIPFFQNVSLSTDFFVQQQAVYFKSLSHSTNLPGFLSIVLFTVFFSYLLLLPPVLLQVITLSVSIVLHILFKRYFLGISFMSMVSTTESVSSFHLSTSHALRPVFPYLLYKIDLLKYSPHISSLSQKHHSFFFPLYFMPHVVCTSEVPINFFITLQQGVTEGFQHKSGTDGLL